MPDYDLLVYHDFRSSHDGVPNVGDRAEAWFGSKFEGLFVTAVGGGIHEGRTTVVLSSESRPGYQKEIKAYIARGAGSDGSRLV